MYIKIRSISISRLNRYRLLKKIKKLKKQICNLKASNQWYFEVHRSLAEKAVEIYKKEECSVKYNNKQSWYIDRLKEAHKEARDYKKELDKYKRKNKYKDTHVYIINSTTKLNEYDLDQLNNQLEEINKFKRQQNKIRARFKKLRKSRDKWRNIAYYD